MSDFRYVGQELELFAQAKNWKSYLRTQIQPWLGSRVLEVGAGIGSTTLSLFPDSNSNSNSSSHSNQQAIERWVCLEPDARLVNELRQANLPSVCEPQVGSLADVPATEQFQSILYIDVLEHIEHDHEELQLAAQRLEPGGRLIVLAPAHQWLFTPFDQAVGHYRRYSKSTLKAAGPPSIQLKVLRYLDSVGMIASLGNRLLLKQSVPTARQIACWDQFMVRVSRGLDPCIGWTLGKSVLAIWVKPT